MKKLSRMLAIAVIGLVCAAWLLAQANDPRPDGWQGIVLGVGSPDDAVSLFGPPVSDRNKVALEPVRPLSWLSDKYTEKVFRTLTYKKLHDYKQVQLSFLDSKLVLINLEAPDAELEGNWIDPDAWNRSLLSTSNLTNVNTTANCCHQRSFGQTRLASSKKTSTIIGMT